MTLSSEAILRLIVITDFIYISLVMLAEWLPIGYHINQIAILVLGFWAILHRESVLQVELLMLVKCISIVLDAISIGMYFQIGQRTYQLVDHSFYFGLSAFFAIFFLIIKPVMLLLLNKVRRYRSGDSSPPTFGAWGTANSGSVPGYTPVDEQKPA